MRKISEYIFKRFLAGVFFYALFGVLFLHGEALATTVEFTLAGSSGIGNNRVTS